MPIYVYKCNKCSKTFEKFNKINNIYNEYCCGHKCTTLIQPPLHGKIYEGYDPYLDEYITGPKQRKRIMKQKHLEEVGNG